MGEYLPCVHPPLLGVRADHVHLSQNRTKIHIIYSIGDILHSHVGLSMLWLFEATSLVLATTTVFGLMSNLVTDITLASEFEVAFSLHPKILNFFHFDLGALTLGALTLLHNICLRFVLPALVSLFF